MRNFREIFILVIVFFMVGCDPSTTSDKPKKDLYVSMNRGNNNNIGTTIESPFKNFTYALNQIENSYKTDYTIYLDEGNYTKENGENFPLEIPYNVKVLKMKNIRHRPYIKGFGIYKPKYSYYNREKNITLILNNKASIDFLEIEGNTSANSIGIYANGDSKISKSYIGKSTIGVSILDDNVHIDDCYISSNSYGIKAEKRVSLELKDTYICDNKIGILLKSSSFTSKGTNRIESNDQCDFIYDNISDIHVENVLWNTNILHLESTNECKNGNDLVELNDGNVNYQVLLSENTPLFENVQERQILSPSFGSLISSNEPTIKITPTNHKFFKIGIFRNRPYIENNEIINYEDIAWTWDTSMKKEKSNLVRYISFNDGKGYLMKGRQYYIALWGWDDDGIKINLSSNISYFVIDN